MQTSSAPTGLSGLFADHYAYFANVSVSVVVVIEPPESLIDNGY